MSDTKGRPRGGNGGARPDDNLTRRLLLPVEVTNPRVLRAWVVPLALAAAKLGGAPPLDPAALGARLLELAAAGRIELLLIDGELVLASACADTPAACRVICTTNNNSNGEQTP